MMKARKLGTIAALGGSTAALAMLTGLAGARADDLTINQQLLDQRVDQLAAVGQFAGPSVPFSVDQNPAAGSPVMAGSFPRSILIPGTDTSLKVYGAIVEVVDYWFTGGNPNGLPSTTVGDNGSAQTIPLKNTVQRARGNGIFWQTPRQTNIGFETRTPTPLGEARTVISMDFTNANSFVPGGADPESTSDNLVPRMAYMYGTLGGFLAGQATSNFSDPDANAETLDFGGNEGEPGHVRIPQIRYTMPAWWGSSLSVAAEQPNTIIATANGIEGADAGLTSSATGGNGATATTSCVAVSATAATTCSTTLLTSGVTPLNPAKTGAPDLTAALYFPEAWGHLDFSFVFRPDVQVDDGKFFSETFQGYGGHVGLDIKPGWFGWAKDDFTFHFTGGDTIGSYLNNSANFDLATNYGQPATPTVGATPGNPGTYGGFNAATSLAAANSIIFKPTQEIGSEIGYQHWWLDNLRSNLSGGFNSHYGIPRSLVCNGLANPAVCAQAGNGQSTGGIDTQVITAHANLIWNPVSFMDVGVEYLWAQREVLTHATATMQMLIGKVQIKF